MASSFLGHVALLTLMLSHTVQGAPSLATRTPPQRLDMPPDPNLDCLQSTIEQDDSDYDPLAQDYNPPHFADYLTKTWDDYCHNFSRCSCNPNGTPDVTPTCGVAPDSGTHEPSDPYLDFQCASRNCICLGATLPPPATSTDSQLATCPSDPAPSDLEDTCESRFECSGECDGAADCTGECTCLAEAAEFGSITYYLPRSCTAIIGSPQGQGNAEPEGGSTQQEGGGGGKTKRQEAIQFKQPGLNMTVYAIPGYEHNNYTNTIAREPDGYYHNMTTGTQVICACNSTCVSPGCCGIGPTGTIKEGDTCLGDLSTGF